MLSKTNSSHLLTNYKMQFKSMRKRTVFNYINGHLGSENLLDQNSLLLLRHIPSKATDENVNTERVRKYFTKQGWKALYHRKKWQFNLGLQNMWNWLACQRVNYLWLLLSVVLSKNVPTLKNSQNQPIGVVGNASKCKIHLWSFVDFCINNFLHCIVFIFQIFYQNLNFILLKSSSILNDFLEAF